MKPGKVIVTKDEVNIENLSIGNEELARHLNEYEDPANELCQLRVGLLAERLTSTLNEASNLMVRADNLIIAESELVA